MAWMVLTFLQVAGLVAGINLAIEEHGILSGIALGAAVAASDAKYAWNDVL